MLKKGSKGRRRVLKGNPPTKGLFLHLRCGLRSLDPCSVVDTCFAQV